MSQAALFPSVESAAPLQLNDFDAAGFDIGWDHARYQIVPPAKHLHGGHPVRQGWQAGRSVFRSRTLHPTPAVRQWLHLRLMAWLNGQAFEGVQVTPNFLAQLVASHCPVTGEPLDPSDMNGCRVFEDAAYAAGNLVALSERARKAKAGRDWRAALDCARRIESGEVTSIDGLIAGEWSRLAVLMSFATPLAHREAATLPLLVLPPNRVRILNAVQALQALLTLQFTHAGYARRLLDLAAVVPDMSTRQDFHVFMQTLLARRVAAGPLTDGANLRQALIDAWLHPLVQRRWQRLALRLSEADCERIVQYAGRRGLVDEGCRWLPREAATDGWALETEGRAVMTSEGFLSSRSRSRERGGMRGIDTRRPPILAATSKALGSR
ncbi:MAG TPA: hypothetical protein VFP68_22465 [Burkholderiaceae bacterium]|nr:hypothetical protein [Burkholderiaceae bacterium]